MRLAFDFSEMDDERRARLRRAGTLLLVLFIHIFGVIGLITLAPEYTRLKKTEPNFTLLSLIEPKAARKPSPNKAVSKARVATPKTPTPPQQQPQVAPPLKMILMDSKAFAAANIANLAQSAAPSEVASADTGGAPGGKGQGPNGERLYDAEWYREPTEAETAPFFSKVRSSGWGVIACRTIDHWHVEDCRELDESPLGSGIARAARLASWQFLVRPPRVGGKMLIGSWVRIKYTITERKAGSRD